MCCFDFRICHERVIVNSKQKQSISHDSVRYFCASYLNKLPACDRYVGGGDAPRTTPACLSRSSSNNLQCNDKMYEKWYSLVHCDIQSVQTQSRQNDIINRKWVWPTRQIDGVNFTYLNRYSCILAWYVGGGGRCWNSGYNKPCGARPLHGRRPHRPNSLEPRPRHCCEPGAVIRHAAPLTVTNMTPTPLNHKCRRKDTC